MYLLIVGVLVQHKTSIIWPYIGSIAKQKWFYLIEKKKRPNPAEWVPFRASGIFFFSVFDGWSCPYC